MFEFTRNFYSPTEISDREIDPLLEGGPVSSFTPGQIIIPEQTVETSPPMEGADPSAMLSSEYAIAPDKLLINFDGTDYEVRVLKDGNVYNYDCYLGESDDRLFRIILFPPEGWAIVTPNQGTYTVSAKIPGAAPKVLSFPKGRTIVSELSRLNKAFGTVSKKKTIIGQLSDIADAAEAGKIGGGSGVFMVRINNAGASNYVMDKTWHEIYDALKTSFVYVLTENESVPLINSSRISRAIYEEGDYTIKIDGDSHPFITGTPDGYPTQGLA